MVVRNTFSILFYIKKHRINENNETLLYMRISINRSRIDMSLHRFININIWDINSGTAKGTTKEAKNVNSYLQSVRSNLYEHYKYLRETEKELTPKMVKNAYLGIEEDRGRKIIELFEEHNATIKKLSGIDYSPETIQRYETSLRHTASFIKYKYGKDDLYLIELDLVFVNAYEMYLKIERRCAHNTTMKYLKNFKKIVRIGIANGWLDHDPFANYKMKLKKADRGFLSDSELEALMSKEFGVERLEEIRDCFVFSCFTGLAHSDIKRLKAENVVTGTDGGQWIKIKRKKTDNLSSIPILGKTQEIINKYRENEYCIANNVLLPVGNSGQTEHLIPE